MKYSSYIKNLTEIAMHAAIICVLAQISLPISVVPITLQAFAVALAGYALGAKKTIASICVYLLLGTVGVPVFAGFKGGFYVLLSYTGGFLWGFIPYAVLCSLSKKRIGIYLGIIGCLVCHIIGVLQYSLVSRTGLWLSALTVSVPYLLKDVLLTVIAYFVAGRINKLKKR